MQNANHRCTGRATMSTERGNYLLITVHAPFLAIGPNQKSLIAIIAWKPWVTDQRWKIQEDVLHGILPKNTVPRRVTHCAFRALKKLILLRPLSQIFLRIPKQYFVFVSSPKKQTHTVCNNHPNIVDQYRTEDKLQSCILVWSDSKKRCVDCN